MRINYVDRGPSPLDSGKPGASADRDSTFGWWGAFSIQKFVNQSPLSHTHADATGWLAYLQQFYDRNFWFADGGAQVWAYEETNDNYQDRYGMDAVCAVYHSGHGGMDGNGVFFAPLGAVWDNRSDAVSNRMALGNEKANYIFWSTCTSLRVTGGHTPIRTWAGPNVGFRMIFGFETVSIDSPDYGKKFWEKWRAGQTYCDAWLNASWDIYHGQAPSVAATGATQAEATNRLNTERTFFRDHVPDSWYVWRWYAAREGVRERLTRTPGDPRIVQLSPREPSAELTALGRLADFPSAALQDVQVERQGVISAESGDRTVSTSPHGVRWVRLAEANHRNTRRIDSDQAVQAARAFAERHAEGAELVLDSVHDLMENSGTKDGSELHEPRSIETHVTFRQTFDGVPVITPDRGVVRVVVDNDGTVVQAQISTREATGATNTPSTSVEPPPVRQGRQSKSARSGRGARSASRPSEDPMEALEAAEQRLLAHLSATGSDGRRAIADVRDQLSVRDVPDTTDIGYEIDGNEAYPAARKLIEIGAEDSMFKTRRWVVAPLAR
ncbi:DUF6345 domain-containing protein [Streptomyces tsukubensis]|uniref:Uncharacterized protein n=1 Tax=Streptomyces tsukubensis TaxID=83656 RepID=A0A1V4ACS7_9ACTN|nr:DUF6345 domain-containing protein [Streptomyces tsukubensis]OON81762.1 hypothetical protein B1H18_06470 [Streptomyces tsukubensis]QFR96544.1 hypothetical protein GBW32_30335 [Streptomyces tsukubensis]